MTVRTKNCPLLIIVIWLLLNFTAQQQSFAQLFQKYISEKPVKKIIIRGNLRTESSAIRRQIFLKIGERPDIHTIRGDIRRIYALKRFKNVQVFIEEEKDGAIIIYKVSEKPAIRELKIVGNKELSLDDIKGVMDIKKYGILDYTKLQKNAEKIKELYREKGYYLAEVDYEVSKEKNASVTVTFRIKENAKLYIRQINFVGNRDIPSEKLRSILQTSEHNLFSWIMGSSTYQKALIARDLFLLQSYYLDRGYATVKLGSPKIYLSPDRRAIYITYWITEGKIYRYGKINISGDTKEYRDKILKIINIKSGEIFNRTKLYRDNIFRLSNLYQDFGYAYVNVIPRFKFHPKKQLIDVTFHIEKGPRVRVERIEIVGNSDTQDKVIRREIKISEGDYYSATLVRISQQRIFALGFFERNDVFGVKVEKQPGSRQDRIIIRFVVKEKPSGTFQLGAGIHSTEGLMFNAQISENNLFGRGQTLSLFAQLSAIRYFFQFQFVEPYFLDLPVTFALSGYNYQRDYRTLFTLGFIQNNSGGSITWGYQPFDDFYILLTYKLEYVFIAASGNALQSGIRLKGFFSGADGPTRTSSIQLTLRYDKRDNRIFPSKGHYQSFSVEYADRPIFSQNRFTRFTLNSRWYLSLPLSMVFKVNINMGLVISPDVRGVPAFERYRLGGINSIRGYSPFTIGPTKKIPSISDGAFQLEDFNWGGSKEFIFNAELEIPIVKKMGLKAVLFFDAGNAYDDREFFFQDKRNPSLPLGLYYSVGFGIRWFSPFGPLRFEWGIPLTPRPEDQPILFEFTIGNSF